MITTMIAAAFMAVGSQSCCMPSASCCNDSVTPYREMHYPLTENDVREPFVYFNNEWIDGAALDMLDPASILSAEVKDDSYGTRSIFLTVSDDTLKQLKAKAAEERMCMMCKSVPLCEFPGGSGKMKEWINDNMHYPEGFDGYAKVIVGLKIMPDGKVVDAHILKAADDDALNAEALRLVNSMPPFRVKYFTPEKAPVRYLLPIVFDRHAGIRIR